MAECKETPCCPVDPYAYRSDDATDSQTASRGTDCPEVIVTIDPTSGSYLFFPSFITLTANHDDAVIRYTIDGTDPTAASTLYSAPFEITQAGILIKARAFLTGCTPGPIAAALYQNPPFPIGFDYSCTTPDKGGTFNVWTPNGNIDSFWQLKFTLTANQVIKRLEMRQLNSAGLWNTGIIYSTNSPLTIDGESFDVMPLLLFIAGVQQHTSYQASLGTFGVATHTWDLYGDKTFSSDGGFWRLDMVLGDDTRVIGIKTTNCTNTVNPTACPSPAAPTITPKCDGKVDVVFANTVGQNYRIYVAPGGSNPVLAASGVTAANPQTVEITGLTEGALYYFYVSLEYAGCGYQSSITVSGIPKADPVVTITSDKLTVDPNENFTISWTSSNIGGAVCGGCLDGEVSINQGLGCKAGNAAGSQATSKATPGVYTYEITGCNSCATVTASVQVTVRDVAICTTQPAIITISNWLTFMCGNYTFAACPVGCLGSVATNGEIPKTGNCIWSATGHGGCGETSGGMTFWLPIKVTCQFVTDRWRLELVLGGCGVQTSFWIGEKLYGSSPVGVYTKTGGCASGPATITIT